MTISYRASGQSSTTSSGSTLIATVLGGGVGNYLGDATLVFVSCSVGVAFPPVNMLFFGSD